MPSEATHVTIHVTTHPSSRAPIIGRHPGEWHTSGSAPMRCVAPLTHYEV